MKGWSTETKREKDKDVFPAKKMKKEVNVKGVFEVC